LFGDQLSAYDSNIGSSQDVFSGDRASDLDFGVGLLLQGCRRGTYNNGWLGVSVYHIKLLQTDLIGNRKTFSFRNPVGLSIQTGYHFLLDGQGSIKDIKDYLTNTNHQSLNLSFIFIKDAGLSQASGQLGWQITFQSGFTVIPMIGTRYTISKGISDLVRYNSVNVLAGIGIDLGKINFNYLGSFLNSNNDYLGTSHELVIGLKIFNQERLSNLKKDKMPCSGF
jgi:hypothetical protein